MEYHLVSSHSVRTANSLFAGVINRLESLGHHIDSLKASTLMLMAAAPLVVISAIGVTEANHQADSATAAGFDVKQELQTKMNDMGVTDKLVKLQAFNQRVADTASEGLNAAGIAVAAPFKFAGETIGGATFDAVSKVQSLTHPIEMSGVKDMPVSFDKVGGDTPSFLKFTEAGGMKFAEDWKSALDKAYAQADQAAEAKANIQSPADSPLVSMMEAAKSATGNSLRDSGITAVNSIHVADQALLSGHPVDYVKNTASATMTIFASPFSAASAAVGRGVEAYVAAQDVAQLKLAAADSSSSLLHPKM